MNRKIRIEYKKTYICSGTSCDKCTARFSCLTTNVDATMIMTTESWNYWHKKLHNCSPSLVLQQLVGSKVFVQGSKKFNDLVSSNSGRKVDSESTNLGSNPSTRT